MIPEDTIDSIMLALLQREQNPTCLGSEFGIHPLLPTRQRHRSLCSTFAYGRVPTGHCAGVRGKDDCEDGSGLCLP